MWFCSWYAWRWQKDRVLGWLRLLTLPSALPTILVSTLHIPLPPPTWSPIYMWHSWISVLHYKRGIIGSVLHYKRGTINKAFSYKLSSQWDQLFVSWLLKARETLGGVVVASWWRWHMPFSPKNSIWELWHVFVKENPTWSQLPFCFMV